MLRLITFDAYSLKDKNVRNLIYRLSLLFDERCGGELGKTYRIMLAHAEKAKPEYAFVMMTSGIFVLIEEEQIVAAASVVVGSLINHICVPKALERKGHASKLLAEITAFYMATTLPVWSPVAPAVHTLFANAEWCSADDVINEDGTRDMMPSLLVNRYRTQSSGKRELKADDLVTHFPICRFGEETRLSLQNNLIKVG